ncbi:MAG: hypothetical protein P1P73_11935 [Brevefilum sp.]|nr:hypothetical protein [Brevefilum sp.]
MNKIRNIKYGQVIVTAGISIVTLLLLFTLIPSTQAASTNTENNNVRTIYPASYAWITTYNDQGGYDDITTVPVGTQIGYQTNLSSYIGHVVNNASDSYVLNWRPNYLGNGFQLCGLRVAYRLPLEGGGFSSSFSYAHVAGSALRPRVSNTDWSWGGGGGCLYVTGGYTFTIYNIHLNIPNGSRIDYLRVYYFLRGYNFLPLILK